MAARVHSFLVIKRGGKNEKIVVLDTQDLSVGRAPENDLVLEDEELSRNHATFRRTESGWVVQNYSNSNSTLVNGEAVTSHPIKNKDVIKVADTELIYYQVAKNPVTVGLPVDYASQLKGFGPNVGGDAEATILGGLDALGSGGGDDFVVGPMNNFADALEDVEPPESSEPRNLDLELADDGLADLDLNPATPAPAAATAAVAAAQQAQPAMEAWTLDEKPASETLSVHLEIQGLTAPQRASVEALLGKVIDLPKLQIRLKGDDLG